MALFTAGVEEQRARSVNELCQGARIARRPARNLPPPPEVLLLETPSIRPSSPPGIDTLQISII